MMLRIRLSVAEECEGKPLRETDFIKKENTLFQCRIVADRFRT